MFYYFKKTTVIVILVLFLVHVQAEDIAITEKCICTQLLSKADCEAFLCTWGPTKTSTADICSPKSTVVDAKLPYSVLCSSQLNPSTDCKLINGCGYIDEKCQQFSGCTAYMGTTNEACQSFSTLCTTNNIICVDPKICKDYTTETECSLNLSTSGSKKCVWDSTANSCRDQTCNEADITLNTDLKCNRFIEGCLTTGKGCTTTREACSTYTTECESMVGSDGYCETNSLGTSPICVPKKCSNAITNIRTDAECAKFQYGCITTGRGCSSFPLPLCSTYTGTKGECLVMTGSDGQCDGTTSDVTTTGSCQVRTCAQAASSNSTDELCSAYKSSCLTNGQGCVDARVACNNYSGTISKCQLYIGLEGKCDGLVSDGPCKAKACTDAPSTYNTDTQCSAFQINCVTTGQGCVLTRQPCATYTGTETQCLTFIGSDGNCSGTGTTGNPCFSKSCALAPATYTTIDQCTKYQSGCVTTGKGCALKTTCLLTQWQVSCTGTPNCSWNSICVDSTSCSYYNTTSLCLNNKANSKECFWTGQACREKLCTDAPITNTTPEACDSYLSGCVTNGAGCLSPLTPCASYSGTQTTCALYIGNSKRCYSTSTTIDSCRDKICADDTISITDGDCDSSLSGCKTKNPGCIPASEPCNSYSGSQTQCSLFTGTNGSQKCYNDTGLTGACRNLVCSDNLTSQTDQECKSFLDGCLTKGTGCISSSVPCSDYSSAGDKCQDFKGNGKACWFVSGDYCVDKQCTHNTTSTTNSECDNFMSGCLTNGAGCVSSTSECTVYHGDETACLKFVGNNLPCSRINACVERACSDISAATTQQECMDYIITCRFNGTGCFDSQSLCSSYINLGADVCQGLTTSSGSKCWLASGSGQCVPKECSLKGSATSQGECNSFLENCMFTGSTCVPLQTNCSGYTTFTQNACRQAKNSGGALCWRELSDVGTCADRACTDTVPTPNAENCQSHLQTCVFNGATCSTKQTLCTDYSTTFSQLACKDLVTISNEKCWKEAGGTGTCEVRACSNSVTAPNQANCPAHKDSCRYDGTSCVDQQASCGAYTGFTQAACRTTTTTSGVSCWKVVDAVGICEDRTCSQDIGVTPNETSCLTHLPTCKFNGSQCVDQQASCSSYTSFTQSACKTVTRIDGLGCWRDSSTVGTCSERACNNPVANPSVENCTAHIGSCRFNGSICTSSQTSCASYTGFSQEQCQQVLLQDGVTKCWKTSSLNGVCEDRSCDNVVVNASEVNCLAHLSTCAFNGTKCFVAQAACSSYTIMLASQCQIIKTSTGGKCWLDQGIASCVTRVCEHNTEATTDASCEEFLSGCKTKGKGCVQANLPCASLSGTQSSCLYVTGVTYKCKGSNTAGQCSIRTCYDNMDATTNTDCESFLHGCVTRGKGCLPSTAACSAYLGVRGTCINFLGNGKKCWNTVSATENSPCVDRKCSDDLLSQTDQACADFQVGCVTKGTGCIAVTSPCNSYVGTQTTCATFIGLGTKKCWNVLQATSLTFCIDRLCSHNTRASTDLECDSFLTGCVNKGAGCAAPQPCAGFLGTARTCAKFTATDGPCKGVGSTIANCIAMTCSEGLSTYNTDQLCNNFKSGCKTNGAGCVDAANCLDMQTQSSCAAKTGCIYVGNCRDLQTECGVFKTASLCVNTPVVTTMKKCTWSSGACRNWICSDASELIITEAGCQALHSTCTTKGKGCITISSCASYTTSIICGAAKTTDLGGTCIWSSTFCRARTCEDASKGFKTDEQCASYLTGCKTTGLGCTSPPFMCDSIVSQTRCTLDSQNRPCIWETENGICVNYSKCIDISLTTHAECQQYSSYCTSDGVGCIALNICQNYKTPTACVLGNDGACGWIPATITATASCVKFTSCDQASGIDNDICKVFNSKCISNGTNCVQYDTCSTYVSKTSCQSGGSDGACFWDTTALTCRLSVCSDANTTNTISIVTHEGCTLFKATKPCTTNGTACVDLNLCSSYLEQGCFMGTDGVCIYDYPVGQIQGTKVCRAKVCSDFKETTTAKCQSSMTGCISTGTKCSEILKCAEYTTKVACNSKGSDGVCVYTMVDSNSGTCALMTKCADANSDQVACNLKPSCNYQTVMKDGVENSSCVDHTCASIAQGGTCLVLPNFEGTKVSVCVPTSAGCTLGETTQLSSSTCFSMTNFAFTWNADTNLCDRCLEDTTTPNNTNTTTTPGTTNTTDTTYGFLGLNGLIAILIGIL